MFDAKTVENFVSQEEINKILTLVKGIEPWENGGGEFWDNRSLNAINIYLNHDKEVGRLLYDIRARLSEKIKELYNLDEAYPDLFQVVRWFPGMYQPPHADDMTDAVDETRSELEWFNHRHYGAIIYLNDDYTGGKTFYPNHDVAITPKAGMLAVHPGDPNHLHGVTEIQGAMRYTLASFWTKDAEFFDGWVLD